jgi:hypothetical protein
MPAMLSKSFLLSQYDDWTQHSADLNVREKFLAASQRAEHQRWAAKCVTWRAHYANLLRQGYGHQVGG